MHGDSIAVRALIDKHADVNVPQPDGATALHWAVFRSDKEMVELLLKAGANAKAANRDGSTPLWIASVNGNAAIVADLLKAGADANEALPFGRTPLMEASRTGSVDTIKVLLDHGANVEAREKLRGTTALMWAAEQGHAPAIQFLIDHGANIKERSDPAERGRGPALGKSNDPRKAVAAQCGAALAAGKSVRVIWTSVHYAVIPTVLPARDARAAVVDGQAEQQEARQPMATSPTMPLPRRSGSAAVGGDNRQ